MKSDDLTSLLLSTLAFTAALLVLGIVLVPVWPPEGIVVLGAITFGLTLFAIALAVRNALRRQEYWWIPGIILFGPFGAFTYSLVKTTESGILSDYLESLSAQTIGPSAAEPGEGENESEPEPDPETERDTDSGDESDNSSRRTFLSLFLTLFLNLGLLAILALVIIVALRSLGRQIGDPGLPEIGQRSRWQWRTPRLSWNTPALPRLSWQPWRAFAGPTL
jgi:hypothetical protein